MKSLKLPDVLGTHINLSLVNPKAKSGSKVRKFRISRLGLLTSATVVLGLACASGYIAQDYSRVQLLRIKHFLELREAKNRAAELAEKNDSLAIELTRYKAASGRDKASEIELKNKLSEINNIIELALNPKYVQNNKTSTDKKVLANKDSKKKPAVGGSEIICKGEDCDLLGLKKSEQTDSAEDAVIEQPASYNPNSTEMAALQKKFLDITEKLKKLPLGKPALGIIGSGFGFRYSPFGKQLAMHEGLDVDVDYGDAVYATGDGVVKEVKFHRSYGLMIDIRHSGSITTRYAHLSKVLVKEGEKISRGTKIGQAGATGRATGTHLHYEVIEKGAAKDPQRYLSLAKELAKVLG